MTAETRSELERAEPPEVLDLLVVGGGPGGTAVAFRGRELGLSVLVVDYDDLMKRIRDYSKDKLILPGFGGGDAMRFPKGDRLVDALRFGPIDKDDMCACWKELYREHGVPVRVGVELTGLEADSGGTWRAQCWDHRERCDASFAARAVAIAIGRGVPRRFDIPGNTDGIAYRLDDATAYVGRPACVIGGGTSAAEAVIAISNAKAQAGDPTALYWSYRGDRMPRVSKALAEVFFEAYVGNGNIRYYPKSEPVAIVAGADRREYLSIRVDRREMAERPSETSHLEFLKEDCIACIGEDIPESLLASFGIHMATGGPGGRKRMVVSRWLESCQPNVFLVGDLLSQAYLETDDFEADPAGFREIKHRGNIKAALRDGVLVAEAVKQRLEGRAEIEVRLEDAEEVAAGAAPVAALTQPVDSGGPPPESLEPDRAEVEREAWLVRLLPTGVEENEYPVRSRGVTTIGSGECDVSFPSDSMLAKLHASISHTEDGWFLRDDGSETGVFLRLPAARKREIGARDLLRIGRQFLLFGGEGDGYGFTHYDHAGREVGRHALEAKVTIVGRKAPDITLAAEDGTLSRRHLALSIEEGRLLAKDLKSVNGSYLRVRTATALEPGDQIRAGQQVLVFTLRAEEEARERAAARAAQAAAAEPATPEKAEKAAAAASVAFKGTAGSFPARPLQTVCEVAEENGVAIVAECHSGICGSDPVRILAGAEHVAGAADDRERETLEELCELEPGPCRLACMLRVRGPVEIEILESKS